MTITVPFDERAFTATTGSLRHVHHVYLKATPSADPIPLDLVSGTLTYDEAWSPHVQGSLQCRVPDDQDVLDLLDARKRPRVQIFAGYVYDDGQHDEQLVASLILTDRTVRRPDDTMDLAVNSDEVVLQLPSLNMWAFPGSTGCATAALAVIQYHDPAGYVHPSTMPNPPLLAEGSTDTVDVTRWEDNAWSVVTDFQQRADGWIYHDGLTGWRMVPRVTRAGSAAAILTVGSTGTLTGSQTVLSTQDFANLVAVRYRWGSSTTAWQYAEQTTGPLGTAAVGRQPDAVEYPRRGTVIGARRAAAALLGRSLSRGRGMSLEVACAPYWLRPGNTVTVQLPTGPQERHIVSRVDFRIPDGTATVRTRQPETLDITTGE